MFVNNKIFVVYFFDFDAFFDVTCVFVDVVVAVFVDVVVFDVFDFDIVVGVFVEVVVVVAVFVDVVFWIVVVAVFVDVVFWIVVVVVDHFLFIHLYCSITTI